MIKCFLVHAKTSLAFVVYPKFSWNLWQCHSYSEKTWIFRAECTAVCLKTWERKKIYHSCIAKLMDTLHVVLLYTKTRVHGSGLKAFMGQLLKYLPKFVDYISVLKMCPIKIVVMWIKQLGWSKMKRMETPLRNLTQKKSAFWHK